MIAVYCNIIAVITFCQIGQLLRSSSFLEHPKSLSFTCVALLQDSTYQALFFQFLPCLHMSPLFFSTQEALLSHLAKAGATSPTRGLP